MSEPKTALDSMREWVMKNAYNRNGETALNLAMIAFDTAIVALYPGICPPAPSAEEITMYEARRALKAIPANALEQITKLEARCAELEEMCKALERETCTGCCADNDRKQCRYGEVVLASRALRCKEETT